MPRSMLPEISIEETERSKNGKRFKGPGGKHIKSHGQQVMSVRTPEGLVRKGTWQVAGVRMPLVSASHIIQFGNDFFVGKDEAYIMNMKKKEKSVLRKEGNVYVLDLFVQPRQSSTSPSKRTETVRPLFGGSCEKQPECDSALGAKSDGNDIELNGETDDEDMEDGEMGFDDGSAQVRNIRGPGQPTVKGHQEHMITHRPYRSWCKFCVVGLGRSAARVNGLGVPWRHGI